MRPNQNYTIKFWTANGTVGLDIAARNQKTAIREIKKRFPHAERIQAQYKGPLPVS